MPYQLVKDGNGWKVCKVSDPTKCFSKKPLTKENAEAQRTAIQISEAEQKGGQRPTNPELYEKVKDELYKKNPKHSLYRSAQLVKEYKEQGGTYEETGETKGIPKWFDEKWISANDYIRGRKDVPCGENTAREHDEYPLCFARERIEKFAKDELKELIKMKTANPEKQLQTKKLTGKAAKPKYKLYKLYKSTREDKKWDFYFDRTDPKTGEDKYFKVSFGHPKFEDYTQHHDKERRDKYLARATKIKGDWKNHPFSPNNLAIHVLWGESTDIQKNLDDYLKFVFKRYRQG
jgi:hypothetical protein